MAKRWVMWGALVAIAASAAPARAADWLTLLDWACDENATNKAAVKAMVLTGCGATEGAKAACDVVSGTPFACFSNAVVARDSKSCDKANLNFEISASTAQTFGWKIEGTLTVAATYALYWNTAKECALTAKTPVPTASGGDYIFKAGEAKAVAIMEASGTGRVTFLGGTVFSESVTKKCAREMSVTAYEKASASACTGIATPTPAPTSPGGTPMPSPTTSPTPVATMTPGPTPVATVTPGPTPGPTPVATVTPGPTASATPYATPFATPYATPFATPYATPFATPYAAR